MTTPITPPLTNDDPRLTAYALGECDPGEAEAIAAAVAADPALAAEVDAIRATASDLDQHFASPPPMALNAQARARIQQAAKPARQQLWLWASPVLAAAAIALAVVLWSPWGNPVPEQSDAVAILDEQSDQVAEDRPQALPARREAIDSAIAGEVEVEKPIVAHLERDIETMDTESRRLTEPAAVGDREEAISQTESGGSSAFMALGTSESARGQMAGRHAQVESRRWGYAPHPPTQSPPLPLPQRNTETFQELGDNPFRSTAVPGGDASTFAIDVDTASYTLVRRMLLQQNRMPPADAVRTEEFLNYFRYAYTGPENDEPFAVNAEVVAAPWQPKHRLVRVGIQGKMLSPAERPHSNLVFLVDTSGSMRPDDRLPLAQRAFPHLVQALDERDTVSIVTYAGGVGIALEPTPGNQHRRINQAMAQLRAAGSTNGGAGLAKAYRLAKENVIEGGTNRVILVTDGDFNTGVTDHGSLLETVRHYAEQGIRITVLGVGTGNLNDHRIETISNRGNGIYRYLDSDREAQRVFTQGLIGDLVTIASDVRIQVFFNPSQVAGWRLIGYHNRRMAREDFNDDSVDAGDIGAGHQVTALYEIIPAGLSVPGSKAVDDNPFMPSGEFSSDNDAPLLRLRLRHKLPDASESSLQEFDLHDRDRDWAQASPDTQWAASVAAFAKTLRQDPHLGDWHWPQIRAAAEASGLSQGDPLRQEFLQLIDRAAQLQPHPYHPSSQEQDREPVPNDLTPAP